MRSAATAPGTELGAILDVVGLKMMPAFSEGVLVFGPLSRDPPHCAGQASGDPTGCGSPSQLAVSAGDVRESARTTPLKACAPLTF